MRFTFLLRLLSAMAALSLGVAAAVGLAACGDTAPPEPAGPSEATLAYRAHVRPILTDFCVSCHGGAEPEGGFSLEAQAESDEAPAFETLRAGTSRYERLAHHVLSGAMPPAGEPAPDAEQRDAFVAWFKDSIAEAWRVAPPNPGRVTARRLNRYEYQNTVRDLLGVDYDATRTFPSDEVGYGFDHIGDVLSMPPILFEKYLDAAETIAAEAVQVIDPNIPAVRRYEAEAIERTGTARATGDRVSLSSVSEVYTQLEFPRTGFYILRARVTAQQAGPEKAMVQFRVGQRVVATPSIEEASGVEVDKSVRVRILAGSRQVAVGFPNDYYNPKAKDRSQRDRNLFVNWFEVEGPLAEGLEPLPPVNTEILTCLPKPGQENACAEAILGPLLRRFFRRPATPLELQRYVGFVLEALAAGEPFEGGIQAAVQAMLVAPQFLFRWELDSSTVEGNRTLTDHELASRLSYFLWSSCPDEALGAAADAGTLRDSLHEHVTRMLADDRARALVTSFAAQWLELRRLETATPDTRTLKTFNEKLRDAMRQETELFVEAIIREDRSILDLIDAPFTYLNETLAQHYRIPGVRGPKFRRVELKGQQRGGLLGHASILTLTSYSKRTSPVLRGKWVLEALLGAAPPPPPPGVGTLEDQAPELLKLSVRERLALHRADPACAVCHDAMDNLGYGFENYDAIGAWRTRDGMAVMDASGVLPGGRSFSGVGELRHILRGDPGYPRCFAEKLLTYALGRGLEPYDRPAVLQIVQQAQERRLRFSAFIHAVVATDAFTMRRTLGDSP